MPTTPPPEQPPPGWLPPTPRLDPRAPYGMPPDGPPQQWGPQFGFQQPQQQWAPQQQVPQASYTEWWWDGHKWRPPVPRLTRWQLIAQVPGAMLKLIFLLILLGFCLVTLGVIK